MTTTKTSKADLIATLAAAGIATETQLRRKSVSDLEAMLRTAESVPAKPRPTADQALDRVAGLLGLTRDETVQTKTYSRATATDLDGAAFTLYRNRANVTVVPKRMDEKAKAAVLAKFKKASGGTVNAAKTELLVPDEAAS